MTERVCLALDLVDDTDLIAEYERFHAVGNSDPAVIQSIRDAGIANMEIYRAGDRLFMIMDVTEDYDAAAKAKADAANPAVMRWVEKMARFQKPVPAAGPDGSWIEMDRIFRLADHRGLDGR
ncbi:L-rhamnose mutarotase [Stakelama saccharophila]|uniref:L-rhamnose mutarotase n=1 Tax=Stakelama saccharophila TaxID=3075605 RepID=A0ABZ0B5V6_9SPHN|nr:L-rhamnose mutarotase [Stakelama sp. W311]WNO52390.1 L-rhamnose mutarotase [Stakelama sp. W311]